LSTLPLGDIFGDHLEKGGDAMFITQEPASEREKEFCPIPVFPPGFAAYHRSVMVVGSHQLREDFGSQGHTGSQQVSG
jgi:hypothetical protein